MGSSVLRYLFSAQSGREKLLTSAAVGLKPLNPFLRSRKHVVPALGPSAGLEHLIA